jgi:hypothetical protein
MRTEDGSTSKGLRSDLLDSLRRAKAEVALRRQRLQDFLANLPAVSSRHPFDLEQLARFKRGARFLKLLVRLRELSQE